LFFDAGARYIDPQKSIAHRYNQFKLERKDKLLNNVIAEIAIRQRRNNPTFKFYSAKQNHHHGLARANTSIQAIAYHQQQKQEQSEAKLSFLPS